MSRWPWPMDDRGDRSASTRGLNRDRRKASAGSSSRPDRSDGLKGIPACHRRTRRSSGGPTSAPRTRTSRAGSTRSLRRCTSVSFSATTTIDRNDFGVSFNAPIPGLDHAMLLSDTVAITLDVEPVLQSDGSAG